MQNTTELLTTIREWVTDGTIEKREGVGDPNTPFKVVRLSDLIRELDEALAGGAPLPEDWRTL